MQIVTVTNRKGGVGKSTYSIWAATRAFHLFYGKLRVCLIDLDSQKTLVDHRDIEKQDSEGLKEKFRAIKKMYPNDFKDRIQNIYPIRHATADQLRDKNYRDELAKEFDLVFIDFPGSIPVEDFDLFHIIDRVVVPLVVKAKELHSAYSLLQFLKDNNVEYRYFVNWFTGLKEEKQWIATKDKQFMAEIGHVPQQLIWNSVPETSLYYKEPIMINHRPALTQNSSTFQAQDDLNYTNRTIVKYLVKGQ